MRPSVSARRRHAADLKVGLYGYPLTTNLPIPTLPTPKKQLLGIGSWRLGVEGVG